MSTNFAKSLQFDDRKLQYPTPDWPNGHSGKSSRDKALAGTAFQAAPSDELGADLHSLLLDLTLLYKRLCFQSSIEQLKTFAALRIEFHFECDKATQYIGTLQRLLRLDPEPSEELQLSDSGKLLARYRTALESSVSSFRQLIGWGPQLNVCDHQEETRLSLHNCVTMITRMNLEAAAVISPGHRNLTKDRESVSRVQAQSQRLADMTITRESVPAKDTSHLWVDIKTLYLGDFPEPRRVISSRSYLQQLMHLWSSNETDKLKLSPRQYGVLKQGDQLHDVMVEFRPYPTNLKQNTPRDYRRRRLQITQLALMLISAQSTHLPSSFPSVQFQCLSEVTSPDNPGFLLVYQSRGIRSLSEQILRSHEARVDAPPKRFRQKMVLHIANQVHGRINPENIFFDFSNAKDPGAEWEVFTKPLLAGFEIDRDATGQSDLIDIEEPHARVYCHPERHPSGTKKSHQHFSFDIFSFGMVMIEIGLWTRFQYLQKYQEATTDGERQAFAKKLRKSFSQNKVRIDIEMGRDYHAIISYCFSGEEDRSEAKPNMMPEQSSVLLGTPNGMQLMPLLEQNQSS